MNKLDFGQPALAAKPVTPVQSTNYFKVIAATGATVLLLVLMVFAIWSRSGSTVAVLIVTTLTILPLVWFAFSRNRDILHPWLVAMLLAFGAFGVDFIAKWWRDDPVSILIGPGIAIGFVGLTVGINGRHTIAVAIDTKGTTGLGPRLTLVSSASSVGSCDRNLLSRSHGRPSATLGCLWQYVVASASALPFGDQTIELALVVSVAEHVHDFDCAMAELTRTARNVFIQVPFVYPFHASPADYRRLTLPGLEEALRMRSFEILESGVSLGPSSALADIISFYLAIVLSGGHESTFKAVRLAASWLTWPLRLLAPLSDHNTLSHLLASHVYVYSRKKTLC